ncbi:sulfurtransferase [Cryomorphaceae bacterium 1068]|nr:sulfurtransferase [Cryomorphaceae bacterium 1068]
MKPKRHTLISAAELAPHVGRRSIVLIDARGGKDPKEAYEQKHIKGARYVDLEYELSDIKKDLSKGGRHPLPTPRAFGKVLGRLGITPQSRVVVYDDQGGANAAARFWWMLRSIGHRRVQVLNGGLQAAERENIPMSSTAPRFEPAPPYPAKEWQWPTATMADVRTMQKEREADKSWYKMKYNVIMDAREDHRYRGQSEPIDLVAGSISYAINTPYTDTMNEQGMMLPTAEIREKYEDFLWDCSPMVCCGSGVTACHLILALESARFEPPALYVGGWSEYSRNKNKAMLSESDEIWNEKEKRNEVFTKYGTVPDLHVEESRVSYRIDL